jgi:hypothetical protein
MESEQKVISEKEKTTKKQTKIKPVILCLHPFSIFLIAYPLLPYGFAHYLSEGKVRHISEYQENYLCR